MEIGIGKQRAAIKKNVVNALLKRLDCLCDKESVFKLFNPIFACVATPSEFPYIELTYGIATTDFSCVSLLLAFALTICICR